MSRNNGSLRFSFAGGHCKFPARGGDQGELSDAAKLNKQTKTSIAAEMTAASQSCFVSVMCL